MMCNLSSITKGQAAIINRTREKWGDIANALSRIEIQTTMTNGRVRKLERWQSYVLGFCAGISLLIFSVLIPLVGIAQGFFH